MRHEVLHILGTARAEGASIARIVGILSEGLDPRRFRIHACFLDGDGPLTDELRSRGVQVQVVQWSGGTRDPRGACRYFSRFTRKRFSIIHQHYGGRLVSFLSRKATGGKLVFHWWARAKGLVPAVGSLPDADAVLTPSRAMADMIAWARPQVVYPGLPTYDCAQGADSQRASRPAPLIGAAARLVPIKGIRAAIRAMALLREECPEIRLEIAGSGPEQPALEREAESIGVSDRVTFLGWQADLKPVMARWDVFVLPSLEEPLPIVGIEAMASGLPVVGSDVDGLPELVQDGISGFLVPPLDHRALADRIGQLVINSELCKKMSEAARQRAQQYFSAEQMCTRVTQIYDELLTKH